jgi:hypothetical protein
MLNRYRHGVADSWLLATLLVLSFATGCGTNSSPYPEAKVKTALGTSSTCAFCRKAIPRVEEGNMIAVQGVAFTVCDAECAAKLADWAKSQ